MKTLNWKHSVWIVVVIAVALCGVTLVLGRAQTVQAEPVCDRYVLAIDASDQGDCSDEAHPCRTVQYALAQAQPGDRICVADHSLAPGPTVYTGTVVITKGVTLDGAWEAACVDPSDLTCSFTAIACSPERVVLDAEGAGRVVSITGAITPAIRCFTITGGDAAGLRGDVEPSNDAGGGIYSRDAAPRIEGNVISGNFGCTACTAGYGRGGGIYLRNAPATAVVSGNLIAHNVADDGTWGQGGGILLQDSAAQVRNNTIRNNRAGFSAGDGGGIGVREGSPIIAGNAITANVAGRAVSAGGGGIWVWTGGRVTVTDNLIAANRALSGTADPMMSGRGGGLAFQAREQGSMLLRSNIFEENLATVGGRGSGGGIYAAGAAAGSRIEANTVRGNQGSLAGDGDGGGITVMESTLTLQGNRIELNEATFSSVRMGAGGGIYGYSGTLEVRGNYLYGNQASRGDAGFGGGIYCGDEEQAVKITLDGNTILNNVATTGPMGRGGGVRLGLVAAFTMTNNVVAHNLAGELGSGVAVAVAEGVMAHNTIAANAFSGEGTGISVGNDVTVTLYNNVIVSQTVGISVTLPENSSVWATHTLFQGNGLDYGVGVTSTDEIAGPVRLDGDYHLRPGSSAIDAGLALAWIKRDIDGDLRPIGSAPDVGADEVGNLIYLPLIVRNGSTR